MQAFFWKVFLLGGAAILALFAALVILNMLGPVFGPLVLLGGVLYGAVLLVRRARHGRAG